MRFPTRFLRPSWTLRHALLAGLAKMALFAIGITSAVAQTFTFVSAIADDVGKPTGIALDTVERVTFLYVSDHDGGRVFRYNLADGSRVQIGRRGTADGEFLWPDAIAVEPATHDVYIADRQLHRITRLTRDGAFVMKWGDSGTDTNRFGHPHAGSAPGQFNGPVGVALDAAGNVYTTEHENHRVQKFRVTRAAGGWNVETLTTWGSGGSLPGQFNTPYGIAVDATGNIWVADGFNSRLQTFTPTGQLLGQVIVRRPTEAHVVVTWVAFDRAGQIYTSVTSDPNPAIGGDIANQRVQLFDATGTPRASWGSYGGEPGQFRLPFGIAIHEPTRRAYVADYDNRRVQVFSIANVAPPAPPPIPAATLVNMSSRQQISAADSSGATVGFVVAGNSPRTLLLRAIGPSLAAFGVTAPAANPRLQVFDRGGRVVADNDDWGGNPDITSAAERVGAFALSRESRDAAVLVTLPPGNYTAQASLAAGTGMVLVEAYDVSAPTSDGLVNLSARGTVGAADNLLAAGFVIGGDAPKRILIRGIGPSLVPFGVVGALSDPVLSVHAAGSATPLAQNDNWETPQATAGQSAATAAEVSAAAASAGAFALTAGGRDAALVVSLPPGAYTAILSSANNTTGIGLLEVFALPP